MALKQMEAKKVTVGDNSFHIKPFPAFKAANLTGELASVLSPLIGAIAPLVGDGDLMDVDVNKAAEALSTSTVINGDRLEALMKKLLLGGNIVIEDEDEEGERQQDVLDKDLADEVFFGKFDYSQFSELELRCYILIKAGMVSMTELQEVYTLDEMLKLYALYSMQLDIEKGRADELERRS